MKKKRRLWIASYLFLSVLLMSQPIRLFAEENNSVKIDSNNFPDDTFRAYVSEKFDKNEDGVLSQREINDATEVSVSDSDIQDLTGIQLLSGLLTLDCSWNNLSRLDVSQNTALTDLDCSCNYLSSLDISQNTALTKLDCYENNLSRLDVSQNTALTDLDCSCNNLSSLDVSQNTALAKLDCSCNNLSSLDVIHTPELWWLYCSNNKLSSLDVSTIPELSEMSWDSVLTIYGYSNTDAESYAGKNGNTFIALERQQPNYSKAKAYTDVRGEIYNSGTVFFSYDENDLASSSMTYNHELAKFCSGLSLMAYAAKEYRNSLLSEGLDYKDIKEVREKNGNTAPCTLAHKKVYLDGQNTEILLIVIQGTYNEEWLDNFDSGIGFTHEGFLRAADYVLEQANKYINSSDVTFDKNVKLKVLVTGHSRGAAAANLLGKSLNEGKLDDSNYSSSDVFVYTFATPNTTSDRSRSSDKYNNIYNIVNPEDFVTKVLPSQWGYGRYGITYTLPSSTTEKKGTGNYVDYSEYENNIESEYKNGLKTVDGNGKQVTYTPYTAGMLTLSNYIKSVTIAVPDVVGYYTVNLNLFQVGSTLHNLYKYALGGNQSNNKKYETLSYAVMAQALTGAYGVTGLETIAFFFQNQVLDAKFATAHMADTYYAAMKYLSKKQLTQKRSTLWGIVNCPVDITIKDEDGTVVGKITDNVVDETIKDSVSMNVEGDSRTFAIPADADYTIELTGNDNGTMDYSLCEIDADSGETERVYYHDVPVEEDATMVQEVTAEDSIEDIELIDASGETIDSTMIMDDTDLGSLSVNVTVEGIGSADSYTNLTAGDYITLSAITDENNEFLGWFDENGKLVSKDADYGISVNQNMNFTAKFTNNIVDVEGISLSDTRLDLCTGDYYYLDTTIMPSNATYKNISYVSSDESVVTVDCGILKAVSVGTATITATSADGSKSVSCEVNVTEKPISECDLSFSRASFTYTGEPIQPEIYVTQEGETVSEDNYEISYSNNINAGTGIIKVTGINNYTGSIEKEFTIEKAYADITANDFTKTASYKSQKFSIKASVNPEGKLTYKSDTSKIKVSSSGKVTIPAKYIGKFSITIKTTSSENYKKTSKTITVTVKPPKTSLSKLTNLKGRKIKVYWKKNTLCSGYQIQYSRDSTFETGNKTKTVTRYYTTNYTLTGLTKGQTYYLRIRTYKKTGKKKYYSSWSSAKKVTVKK